MKNKIFISLFFVLILSCFVYSQEFESISLNPYYKDSMSANVNYTYSLVLHQHEIISIESAIIEGGMWIEPSVNITILVDNQNCSTKNNYISTAYASVNQAHLSFDCSNIINHIDNYTIIIKSSKNSGSSFFWANIVYEMNETPPYISEDFLSFIWDYDNRTLTYYPESDNSTIILNISEESIWNYNNRTLTYYPESIIQNNTETNSTLIIRTTPSFSLEMLVMIFAIILFFAGIIFGMSILEIISAVVFIVFIPISLSIYGWTIATISCVMALVSLLLAYTFGKE